jgi:FMN phosphatase YigB (HAD superfamily)
MPRAVLVDVGGTLWPDRLGGHGSDEIILARLASLLPGIAPADSLAALRAALRADDQSPLQDTRAVLRGALEALGVDSGDDGIDAIRRALCAPAVPVVALFPGARELLETIHGLGLQCVVLSNVQVRGGAEYRRDFNDLDVAHLIDVIVTSLDVGFRKPRRALFDAGLRRLAALPASA